MNTNRCLWGVATQSDRSYLGGCSFAPRAARRFSYRWDQAAARLTLTYRGSAVVTVHALPGRVRPAPAGREPRRSADAGRVPRSPRRRHGNGDCRLCADRLPGVAWRRRSSHASAATFSSIHRAGRSPTISRSTPAPRTSLFTRSRVGRSTRFSSASSTRRACAVLWLVVLHRPRVPDVDRPRGDVDEPVVRVRIGAPPNSRSSRTGTTTASTRTRRCRASSVPGSARTPRRRLFKANLNLVRPFRDWATELRAFPRRSSCIRSASKPAASTRTIPTSCPRIRSFGTTADFSAMIAAAHGSATW